MRSLTLLVLVLSAAGVLGCGRETTVQGVVAPPPEPCTEPASFICSAWRPCEPSVVTAVFEIQAAGPAIRDAIERAGGTVLHEYHVTLIRARLHVSSVPALVRRSVALQVRPDQGLEFDGLITFPHSVTTSDRGFLESIGVTVLREFQSIPVIYALIPDAAVPAILSRAEGMYVEVNRYICGGD